METNLLIGIGVAMFAFDKVANLIVKLKANGKPHDDYKALIERHLDNQQESIDLQKQQLKATLGNQYESH